MKCKLAIPAIVWMVVLGLSAQSLVSPFAVAAEVEGGYANGETVAKQIACEAEITYMVLPYILVMDDGDDVYYKFYVRWKDERPGTGLPKVWHHFSLAIDYPGRQIPAIQKAVYTDGETDWLEDTLTLWVYDAEADTLVYLSFGATCTPPPPNPQGSDSDGGPQYYLDT